MEEIKFDPFNSGGRVQLPDILKSRMLWVFILGFLAGVGSVGLTLQCFVNSMPVILNYDDRSVVWEV